MIIVSNILWAVVIFLGVNICGYNIDTYLDILQIMMRKTVKFRLCEQCLEKIEQS